MNVRIKLRTKIIKKKEKKYSTKERNFKQVFCQALFNLKEYYFFK